MWYSSQGYEGGSEPWGKCTGAHCVEVVDGALEVAHEAVNVAYGGVG